VRALSQSCLGIILQPRPPVTAPTFGLTKPGHGLIDTQSIFAAGISFIPDADAEMQSTMVCPVERPGQTVPISRMETEAEAGIAPTFKQAVIPQHLNIQVGQFVLDVGQAFPP